MNDSGHGRDEGARSPHGVAELVFLAAATVRLVRRRWPVLAAAVVIALLVAIVQFSTAPRIYESRATVLVSPRTADASEQGGRSLRLADVMPTYVKLFGSRTVLTRAAERLAGVPDVAAMWRKVPESERLRHIQEHLTARGVRRTHLIELAYRSRSPRVAHATLESLISAYHDFIDEHHRGMAVEVADLLERERHDVQSRIEQKQQQLRRVQRALSTAGMLDHPDAMHPLVARVLQLNEALMEARSRRVELESQQAALEEAIRQGRDLGPLLLKIEPLVGRELMLAALGLDAESTESSRQVEQDLLAARTELQSVLPYLGPAHPRVRQLQEQIARQEAFLSRTRQLPRLLAAQDPRQLGPLLRSLVQERLTAAQVRESKLMESYQVAEREAAALQDRWSEFQLVQHDLELLRKLHDTLVNRLAQLDLTQEQAEVRLAVVNPPIVPREPVSPRAGTVFPMALAAGLLVGLLSAYALELLDDRFRTPDQIEEQLQLPLLSVIGQLAATPESGLDEFIAQQRQDSADAEAFRTLRTTLYFTARDLVSLAVTSAEPGDGKTTVLVSLASSLARSGKRVLVIDADLRKPAMTRVCQLRGRKGLVELLSQEGVTCEEDPPVVSVAPLGIDVLPAGRKTADAAELLQRDGLVRLLAWAEAEYDLVLVDCPPVMAASDAAIVGDRVDATMVVVQPGKNRRRPVVRAVDRLRALGVHLVGVVANRVTPELGDDYGYGYGYGYGDSRDADGDDASATLPLRGSRAA